MAGLVVATVADERASRTRRWPRPATSFVHAQFGRSERGRPTSKAPGPDAYSPVRCRRACEGRT
eukprot:15206706-Heterocapsa_arctica.AAC.1